MTDEIKKEEEVVVTSTTETEQDPLKVELEKVQRTGKTEKEKAEYSLKKNAQRVRELGGDPDAILGVNSKNTDDLDEDDDKPITRGELKRIEQARANKSAIQLAEEIPNETERELTKYHLENSIKSTGNPAEDLKLARSIVNAVKNTKIIEEATRKGDTKNHSSSSGVDAKNDIVQGELTAQEIPFLSKPFNMTKEAIIKARPKK